MCGVREIEFTGAAVKGAGDNGGHAQGAIGYFGIQREFVVERGQQPGGVANVRKFVQQAMNVMGNPGGYIAVPDAIGEHHTRNVVTA